MSTHRLISIFKSSSDDLIVKVAEDTDKACELLEDDLEYVRSIHGKEIFWKRK